MTDAIMIVGSAIEQLRVRMDECALIGDANGVLEYYKTIRALEGILQNIGGN